MSSVASDRFILQAPLGKVLWQLSWPGILGMLLFGINTFVDALFIGHLLGETALAGVSVALPMATTLTIGLGSLLGSGTATLLSIAIGAKDQDTQAALVGALVALSLALGLPLTLLGYLLAGPAVALMGGQGEILSIGTLYMQHLLLGATLQAFGLGGNMLIRSEGRMKRAMAFAGAGLIVNIILNPLLISGLGLGVAGSAWATNIAYGVYSLLNLWYFRSGKASFPSQVKWVWKPALNKKIIALGAPSLIIMVMTLLQQGVIFRLLAQLGVAADVAFYGAVGRIMSLAMLPVFGLVRALQPVIGMNYGARQPQRVREAMRLFTWAGIGLLGCIWLPMMLFPEVALQSLLPQSRFTPQDIWHFRIVMFILPGISPIFMGITLYQSVGKAKLAAQLAIARQLLLFIPAAWLMAHWLGISGIYYALTAVDLGVVGWAILTTHYLLKQIDTEDSHVPSPIQ